MRTVIPARITGCPRVVPIRKSGLDVGVPMRLSPFQILSRASHVLCGGRVMVDVASVDVGPTVEQQSGDLNGGSEMGWLLG